MGLPAEGNHGDSDVESERSAEAHEGEQAVYEDFKDRWKRDELSKALGEPINARIYQSLKETVTLRSIYISETNANILRRFGVGNQLIETDNVKVKHLPVQAVKVTIFAEDVQLSAKNDED